MLIPRDILIPFEFECGKFDSRPGAGLVWAHARVADQWMDGAWTRGMPGYVCEMGGRWGGDTWGEQRSGPRPQPNNTRGSQSPLSWHTVNISSDCDAVTAWQQWLHCEWHKHECPVIWERNVGGISLKNKVRTNERLDKEFRLYKYSNTRCDRNSR